MDNAQGYQIIATGRRKYMELAISCACSIRYWDSKRPIQLVTDMDINDFPGAEKLFDIVTKSYNDKTFFGTLDKLNAEEYSVYEKTMFVDADCLFLKDDIDNIWNAVSGKKFAISGKKSTDGEWYGSDVSEILLKTEISYLVRMNSGSFYFEKQEENQSVLNLSKELYKKYGNFTGHIHRGIAPPDEPYLALAMGALGLDPEPVKFENGSTWMLSTIGSDSHSMSAFDGHPLFNKGEFVSPTICHFVGLEPLQLYNSVVNEFRDKFNIAGPVY